MCVWAAEEKYEYEVQQVVVFFCCRSNQYDALMIPQGPVSKIVKRKYEFGVRQKEKKLNFVWHTLP